MGSIGSRYTNMSNCYCCLLFLGTQFSQPVQFGFWYHLETFSFSYCNSRTFVFISLLGKFQSVHYLTWKRAFLCAGIQLGGPGRSHPLPAHPPHRPLPYRLVQLRLLSPGRHRPPGRGVRLGHQLLVPKARFSRLERRLPVLERRLPVLERRLPVLERRLPVLERSLLGPGTSTSSPGRSNSMYRLLVCTETSPSVPESCLRRQLQDRDVVY